MEEPRNCLGSYEVRQVVLFGAAASSSIIFSVLLLLFLSSQFTDHTGVSTYTIREMLNWAEFFLFVFVSDFSASSFVRRFSEYLSRFGPSWLPIAIVGSVTFAVSFILFVWVSSILTYTGEGPFQDPPPTIWQLAASIVFLAAICSVVSLLGTSLASAIYDLNGKKHVPYSIITQKD